ncbi:CPBP family intramembrane metalloprotease [Agromyces fucosus]|uniref:CPBP family intramembrane metalloprotease n=1 Tax=Agromyces fucosus TaxID=41985 RepID=A0A4Q2JLH3_9MICO|nr:MULTISPECIES: CPBP family intramembrane glutamic endopeptidase [Agromyces]KQZ10840.1 abortive infection protein [Agromyces sp. Root1464]RXZ48752.1 CPBP family intramembrane metalloprotease [Agromyces fucosus]
MTDHVSESRWQSFWNRGGWWKAFGLAAVYLALYLGTGWVVDTLGRDAIDFENLFGDALSVFLAVGMPVIVGSIILLAFAWSLGWIPKPLFTKQPVRGSWWMWIAPVLVLIPVLLRLFGTDYSQYTGGVIAVTFLVGIFVGVSEELLTRGLAVTLLRKHGYNEWVVAVLSSLIFAMLHSSNVLSGQPIVTVLVTMGYTFVFGIMMYLTLRVTGNLIWPILLHAITDPTTFLATGGIDVAAAGAQNPLLAFVTPATLLMAVFALIALIFIRGRADAGVPGLVAAHSADTAPKG